jgi:hypothetical protein
MTSGPAPPLASSIQLKGTSFLDTIAATQRREGDRRYREIVASLEPIHRKVFESVVVPTRYYPLDALVAFLAAGFQLSGDDERLLIRRSEAVAEQQLTGIYRTFVRPGSPEFVIQRIAVIHQTYFAGCQVILSGVDQGSATVRYVGFRKEQRLIEYIQIGFYNKALDICGARGVVVVPTVSIAEGRDYSELSITWRK